MKLIIDIDDEMVCNDIKCRALEPASATDEVIIDALYNGVPYEDKPTGKWIMKNDYTFDCNLCGCSCLDKNNYCPDCGADMREEEENEI